MSRHEPGKTPGDHITGEAGPVIAISGPPGAGKSTLCRALAARIGASAPIEYDSYETMTRQPPGVVEAWLARGAPYEEIETPGLADALRNAACTGAVVFETPLGRAHPESGPLIDISIWLTCPDDVALASKYRGQCVKLGEHERAIQFFEQLAREQSTVRNVRLQLSSAYVDNIPTRGGMAAIVSKGTLARQGLDQLDMLIDADATWWPAVYARAMNHLHWPKALMHSSAAARDFRSCIALQTKGDQPPNARSYYVRVYVGLGDALAKNGNFDAARTAWQEGAEIFPGNSELIERLALTTAADARKFVETVRNLEQQIDTDFTFLLSP